MFRRLKKIKYGFRVAYGPLSSYTIGSYANHFRKSFLGPNLFILYRLPSRPLILLLNMRSRQGSIVRSAMSRQPEENLTKAGEDFREDLRIKGLYRPLQPISKSGSLDHRISPSAYRHCLVWNHLICPYPLKTRVCSKRSPKRRIDPWVAWNHHSFHYRSTSDHRAHSGLESLLYHEIRDFIEYQNILFLIMVTTAAIVTFVIGPKFRKRRLTSHSE